MTLALVFGAGVWKLAGHDKGVEFLTGYLLELSLSADNVFVIAMLFTYFGVPDKYQHKVLIWGVIGAVVMRFVMILGGTALVKEAAQVLYAFRRPADRRRRQDAREQGEVEPGRTRSCGSSASSCRSRRTSAATASS